MLFLSCAILLAVLCATEAIRLDWLPNDANAPLPLSTTYRAKLKQLCVLYEEMGAAKAEKLIKPAAKIPIMKQMCVKLKLDEGNIAAGEWEAWQGQYMYFAQMVLLACLAIAIYTLVVLYFIGSAIPGALWHNVKYTVNGCLGRNTTYTTRRADGFGFIYGKAAGTSGTDTSTGSQLFSSRIPGVKIPAGITLDTAEARAAHDFLLQQRLKRFAAMQKGAKSDGDVGVGVDAGAAVGTTRAPKEEAEAEAGADGDGEWEAVEGEEGEGDKGKKSK